MAILKILFVGIFLSFIPGVLIRISVGPQAYVYPVDVAVLLFVLYGWYLIAVERVKLTGFKPYLFFIVAATMSLLINLYWLSVREFVVSSMYLLRFVTIFSIFPIIGLLFKKNDLSFLIKTVALSLFAVTTLGILQYFLYPDLRNLIYLGWDEHLYRVFSTFLDPNFASIIFIIALWIFVYLFRSEKPGWKRFVIAAAILLTFVFIMLTYSRTGYLALIASVSIFSILEKKLKFLLITGILLLAGIFLLPKEYVSEGVNLFRTASIYSRLETYQTAISIFKDHPIFGVGFNAYRYAQQGIQSGVEVSHAGAGVSNSYLFVLATTGLIGAASFIYMIISMFKEAYRSSQKNKLLPNLNFTILTAVFAGSITENAFFYSFIMILCFTLLGIGRAVMGDK